MVKGNSDSAVMRCVRPSTKNRDGILRLIRKKLDSICGEAFGCLGQVSLVTRSEVNATEAPRSIAFHVCLILFQVQRYCFRVLYPFNVSLP